MNLHANNIQRFRAAATGMFLVLTLAFCAPAVAQTETWIGDSTAAMRGEPRAGERQAIERQAVERRPLVRLHNQIRTTLGDLVPGNGRAEEVASQTQQHRQPAGVVAGDNRHYNDQSAGHFHGNGQYVDTDPRLQTGHRHNDGRHLGPQHNLMRHNLNRRDVALHNVAPHGVPQNAAQASVAAPYNHAGGHPQQYATGGVQPAGQHSASPTQLQQLQQLEQQGIRTQYNAQQRGQHPESMHSLTPQTASMQQTYAQNAQPAGNYSSGSSTMPGNPRAAQPHSASHAVYDHAQNPQYDSAGGGRVVQAQLQAQAPSPEGYLAPAAPVNTPVDATSLQAMQQDYSYDANASYPEANAVQLPATSPQLESGWPEFRFNGVPTPTATERALEYAAQNEQLRIERQGLVDQISQLQYMLRQHQVALQRIRAEIDEARNALQTANETNDELHQQIADLQEEMRLRELETTRMLDGISFRLDDLLLREMNGSGE